MEKINYNPMSRRPEVGVVVRVGYVHPVSGETGECLAKWNGQQWLSLVPFTEDRWEPLASRNIELLGWK